MRYDIFIRLSVLFLVTCASCASRRSRYTETFENGQTRHQSERRTIHSQAHRLTLDSHHLSVGYLETVTITPIGRFTYGPDSGYRGHAARIELQRKHYRTERDFRRDSTQQGYRTAVHVADSLTTAEVHAVEHREKRHAPWRWIAAAVVLILIMGVIVRRLFR